MICDYGCGQEGKYQFKNGKWCCSITHRKCPSFVEHLKKISTYSIPVAKKINTNKLCDYGCGEIANYKFKNNKLCCSKNYLGCKFFHDKTIRDQEYISFKNEIILCDYGCGEIAKFTNIKNDKFCCSKNWGQCKEVKRKNSETNQIKQSGENNARYGVKLTDETKQKIRLGYIKDMQNKFGQVFPNYNKNACKLIEEYGKINGYDFQHAENGGEFFIKELGYWVDGYDKEKNVVIEVDESFHYDYNNNLVEKDIIRQKEIEKFLNCQFIRITNF